MIFDNLRESCQESSNNLELFFKIDLFEYLITGAAEGVQDWSDHLKMNLYLTIIGPTITLKIQGFDHK